jgi:hypothetical protein
LLTFIRALTIAWQQVSKGKYKHNNMRFQMSAQSKLTSAFTGDGNVTYLDAMVIGAGLLASISCIDFVKWA